jgi:hypothetical protein
MAKEVENKIAEVVIVSEENDGFVQSKAASDQRIMTLD